MEEWIKLLREFGFPAGVAAFVLWRVDRHLQEIALAIVRLNARIARALNLPDDDA